MNKKIEIMNPKAKPETADEWVEARENKKHLTIDVPISLHTRLKVIAAKRSETMANVICNLIEENLTD